MKHSILLACLTVVALACSSDPAGNDGKCTENADCDSGEVCAGGACQQVCNDDSQCETGTICDDSVCVVGTRGAPTIAAVDGDGSEICPDAGTTCMENGVVVSGTNLDGAAFSLNTAGAATPMERRPGGTDTEVAVDMPDVAAGNYVLVVTNAAGSDQTELTLLQGPKGDDGEAFSPTSEELVALINGATTTILSARLPVGTGASDVAAGDHTHAFVPSTGGTLTGDLEVTGNLTLGGSINGVNVGASGGLPLMIAGIAAGTNTGTTTGAVGFPFEFAVPPVVILTPGEPDNSGVTRCRIIEHGTSRAGWSCWVYTAAGAAQTMNWLAVAEGVFDLPTQGGSSVQMMAGVFDPATNANCSTCLINFPATFASSPIIFITVDESYNNSGPTGGKVVSFNTTAFTVDTTHGGSGATADRIHWFAIEDTSSDPAQIGRRLVYAGAQSSPAQSGNFPTPATLDKLYSSLLLTVDGGTGTSARTIAASPRNDRVDYAIYTDTAGGGANRLNWMAWVEM